MRTGPTIDSELLTTLTRSQGQASPLTPGNVPALRAAMAANFVTDEELEREFEVHTTEHEIRGPEGAGLTLLSLRPATETPRRACIFYVHGGGLVAGGYRGDLRALSRLALELDVVVVTIEYRLAPEHPFPAALQDCLCALQWLAEGEGEGALDIDASKIALMGGSAGGAIAGGLALLCRDLGKRLVCNQVLLQPMLDHRNSAPSTFEITDDVLWDRLSNGTAWAAYLGTDKPSADVSAYASPARAVNLSDLPPTYIEVGAVDLFRDESIEYVSRLCQAGVPVEFHLWPGAFHGFDSIPSARVAQAAIESRISYFRRAFEGT